MGSEACHFCQQLSQNSFWLYFFVYLLNIMNVSSFLRRTGMTQKNLKDKIDCSMGLINSWTSSRAVPSYEKCVDLINAGITLTELFDAETADKVLKNSASNADLSLNKVNEQNAKMEKLKMQMANDNFELAMRCLKRQNIEAADIETHFFLLASHYSTLVGSKKELTSEDIKRLNALNDLIDKKYKKEDLEGSSDVKNFRIYFYLFVSNCYGNEFTKKEYLEKLLESQNNLYNKITGQNRDVSELVKQLGEAKKRQLEIEVASKNSLENELPLLSDLDLCLC